MVGEDGTAFETRTADRLTVTSAVEDSGLVRLAHRWGVEPSTSVPAAPAPQVRVG